MSMTIGQVLDALRTAKPDTQVHFDFCYCAPTSVHSWRGIYAEPALGWEATGYSGTGLETTVGGLIAALEKAIDGTLFTGWKGGDYRYDRQSPLHIDNRGDCSNTELNRVEVNEWGVTLHTEKEPD